ncbi:hypothetical protein MTR40_07665 [Escherichia coli]|uniref:Uncharacterized protein n=1 Tax=Escherichia coli TaxID=562 RepID=A0AAP3A4F5_ECOLX|nr:MULTISPECIES: hypothetical protein [Enterobacteriaceae]MCP6025028.1 hypothetical protein [Klebsiella pneumoniae]MCW4864848.1 hypothetical protein [Enterobacter hormaechei subsp. xiangfangensis]MCZ8600996.1 hypothetical protein [Escherichia albertii]UUX65524.1 hypothetical protein NUI00_04770 [Escherichia coli O15:H18]UYW80226.1 hypothetical protein N7L43_06570 [Escherichia coli O2:K2:H1]
MKAPSGAFLLSV